MEKVSMYDLKDHPFFRNMLIYNGTKAFDDFVKLFQEESLDNEKLDNSIVVKALDTMFSDPEETFYKTIPSGTNLYRCRTITSSQDIRTGGIIAQYDEDHGYTTRGYNCSNSKEAPLHRPSSARANIEGMSYLYLAEEPYTACAEIRPANHSYVSVAKFRIVQDAHIIDLRSNRKVTAFEEFEREHELSIARLITLIMREFGIPSIDKSIYRITQFVSDYIRKAGFDGVRYQSAMSAGTNITLFNSHKSRVEFVDSKVVLVNAHHLEIIDLESGELLPEARDTSWKPEYLDEARHELERMVEHSMRTGGEETTKK